MSASCIRLIRQAGTLALVIMDWYSLAMGQCRRRGFDPWIGKIHWRRKGQLTPVFLPGESHEQRSLAGYSLRGHKSHHDRVTRHTAQHTLVLEGYFYVGASPCSFCEFNIFDARAVCCRSLLPPPLACADNYSLE